MLLSVNWLREFVPYEGTTNDLADRLTMLGLEVEEITHPFADIRDLVVGRVVECRPHPSADRLWLCKTDVGDEVLSIVCGAPNVAKGQLVPVAKVGTTLPGGLKISKVKLRGEPSHGMILAEDEMGLGPDHSGIMVLAGEFKPGRRLVDCLGLDDTVLNVAITPNRADCLSILGLAREVSAAFKLPLKKPKISFKESGPDASGLVAIEIPEPEYCPLYQARIIRNVTMGPSPARVKHRLISIGVRPINNVVDVTNYVMMEYGQPLHAFDRRTIRGDKIRVARAQDGMEFVTLDDQKRILTSEDLLIWDAERPIALAGVMGGANTEMSESSTEVLLESAVFRPGTVRKTARRLAIPSESSYRFERGVDQAGNTEAMNRAAQLMAEWAGGTILPGVAKAEPRPWKQAQIRFRPKLARSLLGVNSLRADYCIRVLSSLGCETEKKSRDQWTVRPPSYRLDLEREVDLVEEVGRMYGLDRIPTVLPRMRKSMEDVTKADTVYDFNMVLKRWAKGAGLKEVVNYCFVGQADLDRLNLPQKGRIPVYNPLSEDQDVLRTVLAPGLLYDVRQNVRQGNTNLRLFEVAVVFEHDPKSETTARERMRLGLLLAGSRYPGMWPWPGEPVDYSDVLGLVEHLLAEWDLLADEFANLTGHPYLDPGVRVVLGGEELGVIGRIKPEIADAYDARDDLWTAELDVDMLRGLVHGRIPEFSALPKFPPVRRDVTVIAPADLPVGELVSAWKGFKHPLVEDVALADVYRPKGSDERNLTLRVTYRHSKRTLKDAEVDREHAKNVNKMLNALPVRV